MAVLRTTPRAIHFCLFLSLNIIDALLTTSALSQGAIELNPLFATFEHPLEMAAMKTILVGTILLGLALSRRTYLLHALNAGITLVVFWNILAVLTWVHYY